MNVSLEELPTLENYKSMRVCKICDFTASSSRDLKRHIFTRKHKKNFVQIFQSEKSVVTCQDVNTPLEKQNQQKTSTLTENLSSGPKKITNILPLKFSCDACRQEFKYKSWLCRHYKTCKARKKITNILPLEKFSCDICKREFTYKKSFSRHYIKCQEDKAREEISDEMTISSEPKENTKILELLYESNKTNKELCEKVLQLESDRQHIIQQNYTTNQYQNNNQVNINLFLNEECKNAMNITDFVNQIQLSIDDLMYTRDHGYVNGISNIFIKNLEYMEPTDRPIHCNNPNPSKNQNPNKLEFYVKDDDKWEVDKENEKLNATIDSLSKRQTAQIKDWEKENPNWNESDEGIMEYMSMIKVVMGGITEKERNKNKDLIKVKLTEKVEINKQGKLQQKK
tara:strand:+ start:105 stop:1298 length:1194 start_codon:yes stop_codon:yes gene_type:complete